MKPFYFLGGYFLVSLGLILFARRYDALFPFAEIGSATGAEVDGRPVVRFDLVFHRRPGCSGRCDVDLSVGYRTYHWDELKPFAKDSPWRDNEPLPHSSYTLEIPVSPGEREAQLEFRWGYEVCGKRSVQMPAPDPAKRIARHRWESGKLTMSVPGDFQIAQEDDSVFRLERGNESMTIFAIETPPQLSLKVAANTMAPSIEKRLFSGKLAHARSAPATCAGVAGVGRSGIWPVSRTTPYQYEGCTFLVHGMGYHVSLIGPAQLEGLRGLERSITFD